MKRWPMSGRSARDGVWNGLDACPDTPANTPVDARGCTRDSDRDGIADNADRCPNTPAGAAVDATGCEVVLIPHTLEVTLFGTRRPGDRVNLEVDVIARYVEHLAQFTNTTDKD